MGSMLRPRYTVVKMEEKKVGGTVMYSTDPENIDSPFVLMPRKDPAAFYALVSYAKMCEEGLSKEIKVWLGKIAESEPIIGTQGKRNLKAVLVSFVESIE